VLSLDLMADGQRIELEPDGPRTVVRVIMPGSLDDAEWEDIYDDGEEGWRTFLQQLRFYLEFRPEGRGRAFHLSGTAPARRVLAAVDDTAPKEVWHESRYQRMVVDRGGYLVGVISRRPLDAAGAAPAGLTVTAYGLDDPAFATVREEWAARWAAITRDETVIG
jgi:hypothetical protein